LSIEKLTNVSNETLELLLYVLNDLLNMIASKTETIQNTASNRHHFIEDDFHTLDPVLLQKSFLNPFPAYGQVDERKKYLENFNRRLQILDDPNYIREYKNILESKCESLIPPDKVRLISSINENSNYLSGVQFNGKKIQKCDVIRFLEKQLDNLKQNVEDKNAILKSVITKFLKSHFRYSH